MANTRNLGRRIWALFCAVVLALSVVQVSAFATDEEDQSDAQIVSSGGTSYYNVDGTTGAADDYAVSISKTVTATGTENLFNVGVNVRYKNSVPVTQSKDAAVTLVIDTSGSMGWDATTGNPTNDPKATRLAAAKAAAIEFLEKYSLVTEAGTKRYVSLVSFNNDAQKHTITGSRYWVDVAHTEGTNNANLNSAEGKINGLQADGGTNTYMGMENAADLLTTASHPVISSISNRFCILLTDGEPTLHSGGVLDFGSYTSEEDVSYAQAGCQAVTNTGADIYAITYGLNGATVPVSGAGNVAIGTWLTTYCGAAAVYASSSPGDLTTAFNSILSETIPTGSSASTVADAMTASDALASDQVIRFVDFVTPNHATQTDGAITWDLSAAAPDLTPPSGYSSYTMSYQVRLDNTQNTFVSEKPYSLAAASVTFTDVSTNITHPAVSPAPQVKGYLCALAFTKVAAQSTGTGLNNATFRIAATAPVNYSKSASSNPSGAVQFTGIPSGASYTLTETVAPGDYTINNATSTVTVRYGHVTVTGDLLQNDKVADTLDPQNRTVTVTKNWLNSAGEEISVGVYKAPYTTGDSSVATLTLNTDNSWTATSDPLPTVDVLTGNPIAYTVKEATGDYKLVSMTGGALGSGDYSFALTNLVNSQKQITVSKTWVGPVADRPSSLKVELYRDSAAYQEVTLTSANSWSDTITVPTYQDADGTTTLTPSNYTVAEVVGDTPHSSGTVTFNGHSYNVSVEGTTITNTIQQQSTGVSGNKTWKIADWPVTAPTPTAVIALSADGHQIQTKDVASSATSYSFDNLPMYAVADATYDATNLFPGISLDGRKIDYTVAEISTGDSSIVSTQSNNNFTNTLTGDRTINVTKAWVDNGNANETRPDSVTVGLSGGGETYEYTFQATEVPAVPDDPDTLDVNESAAAYTTWDGVDLTHAFTVPEYDVNGALISYSVYEKNTNNSQIAGKDGTYYSVTTSGSADDGFTVTNTLGGGTTNVSVTKNWVDPAGTEHPAVNVGVYQSGSNTLEETLTLDADNHFSTQSNDLPLYSGNDTLSYYVRELDGSNNPIAPGNVSGNYTVTYANPENSTAWTVTNTILQTNDVTVNGTKTWVGGSADYRPDVTFTLYADTAATATKTGSDLTATGDPNVFTFGFTNLPRYAYTDGGCHEISYTIGEAMSGNMASHYDAVSLAPTPDGNGTFNFVNTFNPGSTSVSGKKVWVAGGYSAEVTVGLYVGDEQLQTQTTSNLQYAFNGLNAYNPDGSAISYTVYELNANGDPIQNGGKYGEYDVTYTANTICNTLTQTDVSFPVYKVWNGPAADSVTFTLTRSSNGQADSGFSRSMTLTSADADTDSTNTWTDSFTGLAKYDADRYPYTYTLTEDGVGQDGTVTIGDVTYTAAKQDDGHTYVNTVVDPETGAFSVAKEWASANETEEPTAEPVTVVLYADGVVTDKTLTLNEANGWHGNFENLPLYNAETYAPVVYTIKEVGADPTANTIRLNNNLDLYQVSYTYGKDTPGADFDAVVTNTLQSHDTYAYRVYRTYTKTIDGVTNSYSDNDTDWTYGTQNQSLSIDPSQWLTYNSTTYSFTGGKVNDTAALSPVTFTLTKVKDGANSYEVYLNYSYSYTTPYNPPSGTDYTLTVKWVDENGNDLASPETRMVSSGGTYNADSVSSGSDRTFTDYTYNGLGTQSDPISGTMNGNRTVIFTYSSPTVIPPENPPLAENPGTPGEEQSTTQIPEDETPLAQAPETGDNLALWVLTAAASGAGLIWLAISRKKRKDDGMNG